MNKKVTTPFQFHDAKVKQDFNNKIKKQSLTYRLNTHNLNVIYFLNMIKKTCFFYLFVSILSYGI